MTIIEGDALSEEELPGTPVIEDKADADRLKYELVRKMDLINIQDAELSHHEVYLYNQFAPHQLSRWAEIIAEYALQDLLQALVLKCVKPFHDQYDS